MKRIGNLIAEQNAWLPCKVEKTGNNVIDSLIEGISPGEFITLAGTSVEGKTELMFSLLKSLVVEKQVPCGFFSNRLHGELELTKSLFSDFIDIPADMTYYDYVKFLSDNPEICQRIDSCPLYTDLSKKMNLNDICNQIRKLSDEEGVRTFIIEEIQDIECDIDFSNRDLYVARRIKHLAHELNVSIIVTSYLGYSYYTRENFGSTMLSIYDLADVGRLDENSDIIIGVNRPEVLAVYEDMKGNNLRGLTFAKILKSPRRLFSSIGYRYMPNSLKTKIVAIDDRFIDGDIDKPF